MKLPDSEKIAPEQQLIFAITKEHHNNCYCERNNFSSMRNRKLTTGKVENYPARSVRRADSQSSFIDSKEAQDDINSSRSEDIFVQGFDFSKCNSQKHSPLLEPMPKPVLNPFFMLGNQ